MGKSCYYCGKRPRVANIVSHSNIKTKTRLMPNLHQVRAVVNGSTKKITACTRCIRSGRVTKPPIKVLQSNL